MSWHHLGGLNPDYQEFLEKHPNKTLIGMMWAMYWRFAVIIICVEAIVFLAIMTLAFAFSLGHH